MALRLFYLRGIGYVEIADLMRIPIGTVKPTCIEASVLYVK